MRNNEAEMLIYVNVAFFGPVWGRVSSRTCRSVWKHISPSNDTEALRCDAFKKQCYMKVNMAIKSFLKRRPAPQHTTATRSAAWRSRTEGVGFKSKDIDLYIYIFFEAGGRKFGRVYKQRGVMRLDPRDWSSYRNES